MGDTNDEPRDESNKSAEQDFNFTFNGKEIGDALGQGMDALKTVLGGIVDTVKEAIGPEGLRNLEASQWLAQVATSIEGIATAFREQSSVPTGKGGELTCFLERLDAEIRGSKFQSQGASFRSRLQEATQIVERADGDEPSVPSAQDIRSLANSAGYFRAAAATIAHFSAAHDK